METFRFYQDKKVREWQRTYFSIKANSYEEAINKLNASMGKDVSELAVVDDSIIIHYFETDYENAEWITMQENEGFSTWEIYNDTTGDIVAFNGR